MIRNLLLALLISCGCALAAPIDVLESGNPPLWRLYNKHESYRAQVSDYANQQGFKEPYEHLATILHELIHIDSLMHQGYFVDGIYYEPYLDPKAWPSVKNRDLANFIPKEARGLIYSAYVLGAKDNGLGNVVDEINAYGHVIELVCYFEPSTKGKQIENALGMLALQEQYLDYLRSKKPDQYIALLENKRSLGIMELVSRRAWGALAACGVEGDKIPSESLKRALGLRSVS